MFLWVFVMYHAGIIDCVPSNDVGEGLTAHINLTVYGKLFP